MPQQPDGSQSAEDMARDPLLRLQLWLVKNNVPYDVAFSLDPQEALAYSVIFGELEGGEYDWKRREWKERK